MFTVLLLASISWAKTPLSDWGGVEDIPTGWRIAVVPIGKTVWHAAAELLRLGAEAEVLAPTELRDRMAELTQAMAARYRTAQHGYRDHKDLRRSRATKHS